MVAKAKFEPIGDTLSPETAFIQASNALDVAAALAIQHNDVEGLNTVASLYIELGARLMHAVEDGDDDDEIDEEALAKKVPLGFNPPKLIPVAEPEEKEIVADE